MAADFPPPTPTPPSIEEAVKEHVDVIHHMRELRSEVNTLTANQQRLANDLTKDRLTWGRIEKRQNAIDEKLGVLLANQAALMKHLGVRNG